MGSRFRWHRLPVNKTVRVTNDTLVLLVLDRNI